MKGNTFSYSCRYSGRGAIDDTTTVKFSVASMVDATFFIAITNCRRKQEEKQMAIFTGCGVAIVTPFLADGRVDEDRFAEIINWQIDEGIDAIIVCGTTGEASTLDDDEHVEAIRFCVEVTAGRVPVIGGAGSNDTRHGINLAKRIEKQE